MERIVIEILGGVILAAAGFVVGTIRERKGMNKDMKK